MPVTTTWTLVDKASGAWLDALKRIGAGLKNVEQQADSSLSPFNSLTNTLNRQASVVTKTTSAFGGLASSLKGAAAAYAGLYGAQKAIGFMVSSARAADQARLSMLGLQFIAKSTGQSFDTIKLSVDAFGEGLISLTDRVVAFRNLLDSGLSIEETNRVLKMFLDVATVARRPTVSLSEAVATLTESYKTEQSVLANAGGLTENWGKIIERGAKEVEKLTGKMLDLDKEVDRNKAKIAGLSMELAGYRGASALATTGVESDISRMSKAWEDYRKAVGESTGGVVSAVVAMTTGILGSMAQQTAAQSEFHRREEEWFQETKRRAAEGISAMWSLHPPVTTPGIGDVRAGEREMKSRVPMEPEPWAELEASREARQAAHGEELDLLANAAAANAALREIFREQNAELQAIIAGLPAIEPAEFRSQPEGWSRDVTGEMQYRKPDIPMDIPLGTGKGGDSQEVAPLFTEAEEAAIRFDTQLRSMAASSIADMAGGIADMALGLREVESIGELMQQTFQSLLSMFIKMAIQAALMSAFGLPPGGGGGIIPGMKRGGVVGLPHFPAGGIVGDPDARLIVAHRGEGVLTRDTTERLGGGAGIAALNRGAGGAGGSSTSLNVTIAGGTFVGPGGERAFAARLHRHLDSLIQDREYQPLTRRRGMN